MMENLLVDHGACNNGCHGCHGKFDGLPLAHIGVHTAEATSAARATDGFRGNATIAKPESNDSTNLQSTAQKFQYAHLDYTCFLCGRGFGSRSLGIHVSQCLKKWIVTEAQLPPDEQRSHPYLPAEMTDPKFPGKLRVFKDGVAEGVLPVNQTDFESFNRAMAQSARKNSQHVQENLGATASRSAALGLRSFPARDSSNADAIPKREGALSWLAKFAFVGSMPSFVKRNSEGGDSGNEALEKIPMAYVCYLCGQQFGSKSLMTHLHHCNRQRELQNLKLRHPRPPLPLPPKRLADPNNPMGLMPCNEDGGLPDGVLPTVEADIRAFNIAMTEYWRAGLPRCLHCKTVFLPEQLPEHQPSCTAASSAGPVSTLVQQQPKVKQASAEPVYSSTAPPGNHTPPKPTSAAKPQSRPSSRNSRIVQAQAILKTGGFRHYRCYLCERKFPGTAIKAHCMECKRMWVKSEEVLPEGMRRLLPPPPPEMRLVLAGQAELPVDPSDVAAFNAAMAAHWETTSLLKCPSCTGCFRAKEYMEHHHRKCHLDKGLPDDTTISLGSIVSSILTPPITQDHGRPYLVPELSLGVKIMNSSKSKHQTPVKGKTPVKLQQKDLKSHPAFGQTASVKNTLIQAAAALESVPSKASKSSLKEPSKQSKAPKASSSQNRPLKSATTPARARAKGGKITKPAEVAVGQSKATTAAVPTRANSMMYTCYLCGVQQRYHSYHMHIGQCARKWQSLQRSLSEPVPCPPAPERLGCNMPLPTGPKEVADFNEDMQLHRAKYAMRHCSNCSKNVSLLAWDRHSSRCKGPKKHAAGAGKANSSANAPLPSAVQGLQKEQSAKGRLSYTCYVCANDFNANKYHAHVDGCRRKLVDEDAAAQMTLPPRFQAMSQLPAPDQRLPVHPQQVEAFNQRMLEIFETLQMSKKLSLQPGEAAHHTFQEISTDISATDVLSEFMGQRGTNIGLNKATPRRESDTYDLFTPLPTRPGMQKGEVMVSCRLCGKAVSEVELFAHAHQCSSGADCHNGKNCSQPGTQRSVRSSHRTSRSHYGGEPMILVRANSNRDSHRVTDEVPAFVSPPTPTISETQYYEEAIAPPRVDISLAEPDGSKFPTMMRTKLTKAKRKVIKRAKSFCGKLNRSISSWLNSVRRHRSLGRGV